MYDLSGAEPRSLTSDVVPMSATFRPAPEPYTGAFIADPSVGPDEVFYLDRDTLGSTGIVGPAGITIAVSDDASLIALAQLGGVVELYEFPAGPLVGPILDVTEWLEDEFDNIAALDLNGDAERLLVTLRSGTTLLFAVEGWELLTQIDPTEGGGAIAARFHPDGETVITRAVTGSLELRDADTLQLVGQLPAGPSATELLSLGPYIQRNGEYLLTTREQQPRLIHLPSRQDIGLFPNEPGVVATADDNGETLQLVTGVEDNALVWNLDVESWPGTACLAAGRNMTLDEWDLFGPANEPYRATCPQWPSAEEL